MPRTLTLLAASHMICLLTRPTDRGTVLLTLPELLKDPVYKTFFLTPPKTIIRPGQKPWRLMVQRKMDGPWAKRDFATYAEAFRFLAPLLKTNRIHDAAIMSRGIAFSPPERVVKVKKNGKPAMVKDSRGKMVQQTATVFWKPKLPMMEEAHAWCTYCRRPVVFRWFRSHGLIRSTSLAGLVDASPRRCTICGAREEFVRGTLGSARRPGFDPRAVLAGARRSR